jgi:hypothetical protein
MSWLITYFRVSDSHWINCGVILRRARLSVVSFTQWAPYWRAYHINIDLIAEPATRVMVHLLCDFLENWWYKTLHACMDFLRCFRLMFIQLLTHPLTLGFYWCSDCFYGQIYESHPVGLVGNTNMKGRAFNMMWNIILKNIKCHEVLVFVDKVVTSAFSMSKQNIFLWISLTC